MAQVLGALAAAVPAILSFFGGRRPTSPNPALVAKINELTATVERLKAEYEAKTREPASVEEVKQREDQAWRTLCNLASQLPATSIVEFAAYFNVALFGNTSVGKSSLINLLNGQVEPFNEGKCREEKKHEYRLGQCVNCKKAEVGRGETTTSITPYPGEHGTVCLWDFPGKNDVVSYYSTDVLSLAKAMSLSVLMYGATVKEVVKYLELLDSMRAPFVVVLSRMEEWSAEELEQEKQRALSILGNQYTTFRGWFAVSAKDRSKGDTEAFVRLIARHAPS